jgi:hypothetical protein
MYGAEAHFSESIQVYSHIYDEEIANLPFGYVLNRTYYDFLMMFIIGMVWRFLAFTAMLTFNRNKLL